MKRRRQNESEKFIFKINAVDFVRGGDRSRAWSRIKKKKKRGGCIPGRTAVCGSSAVCLMDSADSLAGTGRLLSGFDEQGEKVVPPYGFR